MREGAARAEASHGASSDHVTTLSMSPQRLCSPMLTFANKKFWTGENKWRMQLPLLSAQL